MSSERLRRRSKRRRSPSGLLNTTLFLCLSQESSGVAPFRMDSRIITATVNIPLVGVKWDIKAINHCLSVLISVQEIREIGSGKSWRADSTLRLHSSCCYSFIVLKTHSGE